MEETKIYRPILKRAWGITWKYKPLWFLGFFAALVSSGGEFELLSRMIFNPTSNKGFIREVVNSFKIGMENNLSDGGNIFSGLWTLAVSAPTNFIAAILVLLITIIIAVFVIWLVTVSQIGLIKNINSAHQDKSATINEGINIGVQKFWPVFIVNLIYKTILLIIFVILGREILLLISLGTIGSVIHIVSLVVFSIITIFISFIVRYQLLYIILKEEGAVSALKSAWKLFINNWLLSLEMAFVIFLIYIIVIYLHTFSTAVLLAVPAAFYTYSSQIPIYILLLLVATSALLIIILTILVTALLSVFQWSAWITIFNQMNQGKTQSKITKLSEQSPNIPNPFNRK